MDSLIHRLPPVRGLIEENAPLAMRSWFRVGGTADILFMPKDRTDLSQFLSGCPDDIPVTILGACSNMIIRDGGIRGVAIKFGKDFADIDHDPDTGIITAGAGAMDVMVARYAARLGLAGIEFLSGIPGTIGGALRMNAGAYGSEVCDILVDATVMDRDGQTHDMTVKDMAMTYRHNALPEGYIFLSARLKTIPGDPQTIQERLDHIRTAREKTQPVKERTGGSTFANPSAEELRAANLPEDTKAWQLVDRVGGRGLTIGGAQMSEKHCNFMINTGTATAEDLELLGEDIRRRVYDQCGVMLRWEIKRIGEQGAAFSLLSETYGTA